MVEYYKMVGKDVVPCRNDEEFVEAMANRWQIRTDIGDMMVSTVFLGLDHRFIPDGPPVVFETMVFPECQEMVRYCTFDDAVEGHKVMVEKVTKGLSLRRS